MKPSVHGKSVANGRWSPTAEVANGRFDCSESGPTAYPAHPDLPGKPRQEIVIDTLELGSDRSGHFHCVLVIVDVFTK